MVCPNCATDSDSKYCPACGQRIDVKRISFREGWLDFWGRMYGFDSMFPRTLRDLTIRPGIAAKRFIEGNRALYYGPVGYFFLMVTLLFLVASILGVDMFEMITTRGTDLTGVETLKGPAGEAQKKILLFVIDNFKIFYFLMVIFQSLWLKVYFRSSGYNVLEHSVLVFFVMGHLYWLTILDVIVFAISGAHISPAAIMILSLLFFAYAASNLYSNRYTITKAGAFVKGIVSYLSAYITFAIFVTIVSVTWLLLDPEMRELVRPSNNK